MAYIQKIVTLLFLAVSTQAGAIDKPNIIFILADDLGYGDISCFGQTKYQTPHLDKMAEEGMKLTSFYAGSTVCAPSRSVLMTGKHTGRAYVRGNSANPEISALRPEDVTIAEKLQEAGYATSLCGKWGLGEEGTEGVPNKQGFDFFYGFLNQCHAHNYFPPFMLRNEDRENLPQNVQDDEWLKYRQEQREENRAKGKPFLPCHLCDGTGYAIKRVDYSHDLIMNETFAWLDKQSKDNPFFLYLALTIPHANNEGRRIGNGQEVPDFGKFADKSWPDPDKGQAAMIDIMDRDIGGLFAKLKDMGIDENTFVIFTSDNGHHAEGLNNPEFFDANGPLRGMKRDLYEGGIRVPTIVRWPGKIAPGTISDHVAYFGDFFATACELAKVELPDGLQSISFLPTLLGNNHTQKRHDYLYWEFYERGTKQAVRFGKWKAIRMPMFTGNIELYDLSNDLGEGNDLASENPHIISYAESLMEQAHDPSPNWKEMGKSRKSRPSTPGDGKMRF